MLIKAQFFVLDLHSSGKVAFNFKIDQLLETALALEEWRHHLRLLEILGEGRIEFDVEGHKPESPRNILSVHTGQPLPQEPWIAALAMTVAQGEALLRMAGAEGKIVTLANLAEAAEMINQAHVRLFEPARVLPQTFITEGRLEAGVPVFDIDVLMIDYAKVAGVPFGYACRLGMRPEAVGDSLLWRQVDFQPLKISVIEDTVDAFRAFADEIRAETHIENLMIKDIAIRDDHAAKPAETGA